MRCDAGQAQRRQAPSGAGAVCGVRGVSPASPCGALACLSEPRCVAWVCELPRPRVMGTTVVIQPGLRLDESGTSPVFCLGVQGKFECHH